MPDAFRAEFTGERVIPGSVEDNLFNEHLARYRFVVRLLSEIGPGRVLDAGCGAGYGTAELAKSGAQVLGIDVSEEAIAHARTHYGNVSNACFEQSSCTAISAEDGAFRLIAAFEVIEHLDDWRGFLREAYRLTDPAGMFLVSTPNRLYYAESRRKAGPNPFHVHEFTGSEFRAELEGVFPYVKILLQNHVEGIAFSSNEAEGAGIEIRESQNGPDDAHFFLAVCGKQPLPPIANFVFIPESGNVLKTRERHIALLDGEIQKKDQWIAREQAERQVMLEKVRQMEAELEEHNQWAQQANAEAERRAQLVAELQEELRKSNEWAEARDAEAVERGHRVEELQEELRKSNEWAEVRDAEAVERGRRIEELQEELRKSNEWAQARHAEAGERSARVVELQSEVAKAVAWARDREKEAEERGQRVVALQAEVAQATEWAKSRDAEVAEAIAWAKRADAEVAERDQRIVQMGEEMAASTAGYEAAIDEWRRAKEGADRWALDTESRLGAERDAAREAFAARGIELENSQQQLAAAQAQAEQLRAQLAESTAKVEMIAQSRWVRLGRVVGAGPEIPRNSGPEIHRN